MKPTLLDRVKNLIERDGLRDFKKEVLLFDKYYDQVWGISEDELVDFYYEDPKQIDDFYVARCGREFALPRLLDEGLPLAAALAQTVIRMVAIGTIRGESR